MNAGKITKYDLVEAVYQNTSCEKKQVQEMLDNLLEAMKKSLGEGNTIELRGFGTFEPRLRKEKLKAHNPKTGEKLSVPAHYIAAFRPGLELRNSMMKLPVENGEPGAE